MGEKEKTLSIDDLIEIFKSKIKPNVPPISVVKDQSNRMWKQAIQIITDNRTRLEDENATLRTLVIQLCVVLDDATGFMMDVAMDEDKGWKYREYVKEARKQLEAFR